MTNGSLMKVESIAELCNTFDLHYQFFGLFKSGCFTQVLKENPSSSSKGEGDIHVLFLVWILLSLA